MAAVAAIDTSNYAQNDTTSATQVVRGTITLSGNYGTGSSHGDTLALNLYGVQSATVLNCFIYEMPAAGTAPSFYTAIYCKGSSLANGVVNFSLAGTEFTEGNPYSGVAALAAAVWKFEATFALYQ